MAKLARTTYMDVMDLQRENERLRVEIAEANARHAAVAEQFEQTLQEKDQQVAALEHQIKLLLQRIRGSRQERIDPDQLMLFSLEELQEIADQLDQGTMTKI